VGGDVWERANLGANRFVSYAMPMLFVLANGLFNELLEARARRSAAREVGRVARCLAAGVTGFGLVLWCNGLLPGAGSEPWRRFLVLARPLHASEHEVFTRQVLALQQSGVVPRGARVAVMWAGIPAYFSDWEMVDLMGYNDRFLAHQPPTTKLSARDFRNYQPGHVKLQHRHMLREHQPDFLYQIWGMPEERLGAMLESFGYEKRDGFWFKTDSQRVDAARLSDYRRMLAALADPSRA
jgi:hypothetical protein